MLTLDNLIGWFALGFSHELTLHQQKTGVLVGKPYTLTRDARGQLRLNDNTTHVVEQNQIIYGWHHPHGLAPYWFIPIMDETHWTSFHFHQLCIRAHPQEIYENSIDVTHFPVVHGFKQLKTIEAPIFKDHSMRVKHCISRKNPLGRKPINAEFEVRLFGIGCAYNHIDVPALNMKVRMFALTTPIQTGRVIIRLAVKIQLKKNSILRFFLPFIHRLIHKNIIRDFCQDIPIFENKCYRASPLLVKGDTYILPFRLWCKQFYSKETPQ